MFAASLAAYGFGCESSSHKSVRMYEYKEEPPRSQRTAQPMDEEEDDSEWHMVPPGQMVVEP
jgi:hypothetical protein